MNDSKTATAQGEFQRLQTKTEVFIRSCFPGQLPDAEERGLRAVEEALELGQALGVSHAQALRLLDYVYSRPAGEVSQELGGAVLTLGSIASMANVSLGDCWGMELDRVLGRVEPFRAKYQLKIAEGIVSAAMADRQITEVVA